MMAVRLRFSLVAPAENWKHPAEVFLAKACGGIVSITQASRSTAKGT